MRSVTWNSACGPPWDAGWPTGAGPSTEADTRSDANPPSNAIVSFEVVKKVDRWLWVMGMIANASLLGLSACLGGAALTQI